MLREMDEAVAQAIDATSRAAGTLRINSLSMAGQKIIAPRLGRFHRSHPEVVLDIVIDDGSSDIVTGGFDAGIRVGGRLLKDMIAVRLTPDVRLLAVASPEYLARASIIPTVVLLSRHCAPSSIACWIVIRIAIASGLTRDISARSLLRHSSSRLSFVPCTRSFDTCASF